MPKGDLRQGHVVVCDWQPTADEKLAIQVRRNVDYGISYSYFLHFSADTIDKAFHLLQVSLVAGISSADRAMDSRARTETIRTEKDRILSDLREICVKRWLRIALIFDDPTFTFRVHNAGNPELAQL